MESTPSASRLKQIKKNMTRSKPIYELSEAQKYDLKTAFDIFDRNCTGFISISDLRVAIRALGYEPKQKELDALMDIVDIDPRGQIAFNDFLYMMNMKMAGKDKDSDIVKAFELMDESKMHKITFRKLKKVAKELGEVTNDEEIQEMITEADLNGDGAVDKNEFLLISKKPIKNYK